MGTLLLFSVDVLIIVEERNIRKLGLSLIRKNYGSYFFDESFHFKMLLPGKFNCSKYIKNQNVSF